MAKPFQYHFTWDPVKAKQNLRKHGVAFDHAATIFQDPEALSEFDEEHSHLEDRWITLGLASSGTVLVVCHTYEETSEISARIRIISARKPTKRETMQYRKG
ncbi:MAG: hypothetical protein NTAFB01_09650 [Nitrospira sp.]